MSTANERIRQMLGFGLVEAARKEREKRPVTPVLLQKPIEKRRKERECER